MSKQNRVAKIAAITAAIAFPITLAACGNTATPSAGTAPSVSAPSSVASSSAATTPSASASTADAPFGSGCSAVPTTGKGSFDGMSTDPVATAASNNKILSTLVTAVKTAGLVDTLNNTDDLTVFAPTNSAFASMDQATLKKALADKKLLTTVLTGHVVAGRIAPSELAGTHKALSGATITVTGSGEDFTVDGDAKVVCGNVQTANATVYIIDGVLLPKS